MALFKINTNLQANKLMAIEFNKEREVQRLFEKNLDIVLNLDFLATEYSTSFGGRIDSLAIDKSGSPVIIEYKLTQNENVINQGLSYLKWLLDHKADFELLCKSKNISCDIDWSSPRVICVAESYNKFDLDTVELLPIKIELLKYKLYKDNILQVESETQKAVKISTSKIFEKTKDHKVSKERLQKDYILDGHLQLASKEIKELYSQLKEYIVGIDTGIIEEIKAKYIAYKLTTNFVDVVIQKNAIKLFLNMPSGKLKDSNNIARDLTKPAKIGHWGNGDYELIIKDQTDLKKAYDLILQSYNYNK